MRELVLALGPDRLAVCASYAEAEEGGLIARASNVNETSAEDYALALWRDGVKKGWLDLGPPSPEEGPARRSTGK